MNALLVKLVQIVFIGCGVILIVCGMDVGSSEHPTLFPGFIVLGMGYALIEIQQADKAWKTPIVHPWALIFSCAGWIIAVSGCWGLIEAIDDYLWADELGHWFSGALTVWAGLALARLGVEIEK